MYDKHPVKLFILTLFLFCSLHSEEQDPLPSWNEGSTKRALIEFAQRSSTKGSEGFIPLEERIATFDQDGTLWVEKPLFTQLFFAVDQLKKLVEEQPALKDQAPFNHLLNDDLKALSQISSKDLGEILGATLKDMTVEKYRDTVSEWLKTAKHPKFNRPFTELVYQPMLELIQLLRDHQFKIYIVSGGGQEFMRAYAESVYGIPIENIIGTADYLQYEYREGAPALKMLPQILFLDDKEGKPEGIHLFIGRKPKAAFGNSTGDQQMLEWTQASGKPNLELLVYHDDPVREYAYGEEARFGRFPASLMKEAKENGWIIVSMKDDWKTIFPWQLHENPANGEQKLKQEELRLIEISTNTK